jgi:hypothetical protein
MTAILYRGDVDLTVDALEKWAEAVCGGASPGTVDLAAATVSALKQAITETVNPTKSGS